MIERIAHSRVARLGAGVTGTTESELLLVLDTSTTVVTVDGQFNGAIETARLLLNLLRRMPGTIILIDAGLPAGLAKTLSADADQIDPTHPVIVTDAPPHTATTRIHIGPRAPHAESVRIIPEGYGAHLIDGADIVVTPTRPSNRLGHMLAAAFGAGEAFARSANVRPGRRRSRSHIAFCPVSLSSDLHAAPDLPTMTIDLALLGCGAVGTAIALILAGLPMSGRLLLADRELFAIENVGTYSLGFPADAREGRRKVDLAAATLENFEVLRHHGDLAELPALVTERTLPRIDLALSGLDSIEARYEARRLWTEHLIDAATGDTVVGVHNTLATGPCIGCVFPRPTQGASSIDQLAAVTGLSPSVLGRDELLTEEDLAGAKDEELPKLRRHLGKPKCGLADAYGLSDVNAGSYRPSVPFVSVQAACLGVGTLIAHLLGMAIPMTIFQYDALRGPQLATLEILLPRDDCYCQQHAARITSVRRAWSTSSSATAIH